MNLAEANVNYWLNPVVPNAPFPLQLENFKVFWRFQGVAWKGQKTLKFSSCNLQSLRFSEVFKG